MKWELSLAFAIPVVLHLGAELLWILFRLPSIRLGGIPRRVNRRSQMESASEVKKQAGRPDVPPGASSAEYQVEGVSSETGLWALREEWNRLWDQVEHPSVFNSFDWVWTWWRHFGSSARFGAQKGLYIVVLRKERRLSGLAPLMIRVVSRGGVRIHKMEFVGGWPLGDHNDFLLDGDRAGQIRTIVAHWMVQQELWDLIELREVTPISCTPTDLQEGLRSVGLSYCLRDDERSPYLEVESDWESFLRGQPQNTRHYFHRAAHRLERLKAQGLRIRIVEDPHREPDLLERMIRLESRKKARGAPTWHVLEEDREFFESILQTLGPRGRLFVGVMELGETLIAYEMGFRFARKLWAYNKAYDRSYQYYCPGNMLLAAILDYACKQGCQEYDFLGGDYPYKSKWTKRFRQNARFAIWNARLKSRLGARLYLEVKSRLLG